MANLASYQKLTRVLPGRPFGDGADGAYSSATIPTIKYKSCSGTASSTTLMADTDASPFTVGDVLLLHQSRGTGTGQWEVNRVTVVGSDTYTLQQALQYTYTDSGASQAQAIKIPRYTSVTVESGTWTLSDWAGDTSGVLALACQGTLTSTGSVSGNGVGYDGGSQTAADSVDGNQGEGTSGAKDTASNSANGSGGGGGVEGYTGSVASTGGGGGGNDAAGTSVSGGGTGGTESGSDDLTNLVFGGGGGSGGGMNLSGGTGGAGGSGGGIIMLFAKTIASPTGTISANGNNGSNGTNQAGSGGGGAGGSLLIVCSTAALGTSKFTSTAGSGGTNGSDGGAGSVGRIAVHHLGTVTGTTSPTFTDVSDTSLFETDAGILMNFI